MLSMMYIPSEKGRRSYESDGFHERHLEGPSLHTVSAYELIRLD